MAPDPTGGFMSIILPVIDLASAACSLIIARGVFALITNAAPNDKNSLLKLSKGVVNFGSQYAETEEQKAAKARDKQQDDEQKAATKAEQEAFKRFERSKLDFFESYRLVIRLTGKIQLLNNSQMKGLKKISTEAEERPYMLQVMNNRKSALAATCAPDGQAAFSGNGERYKQFLKGIQEVSQWAEQCGPSVKILLQVPDIPGIRKDHLNGADRVFDALIASSIILYDFVAKLETDIPFDVVVASLTNVGPVRDDAAYLGLANHQAIHQVWESILAHNREIEKRCIEVNQLFTDLNGVLNKIEVEVESNNPPTARPPAAATSGSFNLDLGGTPTTPPAARAAANAALENEQKVKAGILAVYHAIDGEFYMDNFVNNNRSLNFGNLTLKEVKLFFDSQQKLGLDANALARFSNEVISPMTRLGQEEIARLLREADVKHSWNDVVNDYKHLSDQVDFWKDNKLAIMLNSQFNRLEQFDPKSLRESILVYLNTYHEYFFFLHKMMISYSTRT